MTDLPPWLTLTQPPPSKGKHVPIAALPFRVHAQFPPLFQFALESATPCSPFGMLYVEKLHMPPCTFPP